MFLMLKNLNFYNMYNTKCFYIGLLCLFFTSNIFYQTTIQGKILNEQGKSLLEQMSLSMEQVKGQFLIRMEIST